MASTFELNRKLEDLKCLICELKPADNTALLEAILEAILDNTAENENNLVCSTAKACDADCNVVLCHTCYTVTGEKLPTTHTNPDDTPYTGDLSTLDVGCVSCGEPIPTYEIVTKDICLEDCTEGCQVFKVNTLTDEITLVNTLGQDGLPTNLAVVPCPRFEVVETTKCEK